MDMNLTIGGLNAYQTDKLSSPSIFVYIYSSNSNVLTKQQKRIYIDICALLSFLAVSRAQVHI